ncbi:MAG: Hsp70 family protein [Pseudonocardiaceae bacterium]
MPYGLGIDLGTGGTVAAITRGVGARGSSTQGISTQGISQSAGTEVMALGADAAGIPTVLHLADDGTALVGPAAEALVLSDPDRVFRGFLHQIGEASGAEPSPASLTARLIRWVVDAVADREGGPPEQIVLAHPAVWGVGECRAVHATLNEVGLPGVVFVPAPVAVAASSAAHCDGAVAVYDLGTTFCASVARREDAGFVVLGEPQMIEDGGGARFDELVLARVLDELGDQLGAPDLDDPVVLAGMAALLRNCVAAREALCDRPEVTIPVSLPGLQAELQLTTDDLETLLNPTLRATVATLRATISAAALTPHDVDTVLVTGGCARMPQVARMLTTDLGRPVALLADPDLTAARGAALLAAQANPSASLVARATTTASPAHTQMPVAAQPSLTASVVTQPSQVRLDVPAQQLPAVRELVETPASRLTEPQRSASRSRPRPRALLVVAAGLLAVTTVVLSFTLFGASGSGTESSTSKINNGDQGQGDRNPSSSGSGTPLVPPETVDSETVNIPISSPPLPSPPLPMELGIAAPFGPQSPLPPAPRPSAGPTDPTTTVTTRPSPGPTATSSPPTTTAPPPTTTAPPPPTTTAPPPTSTTTAPPPSSTATPPPPTSTTTAPPEPNP